MARMILTFRTFPGPMRNKVIAIVALLLLFAAPAAANVIPEPYCVERMRKAANVIVEFYPPLNTQKRMLENGLRPSVCGNERDVHSVVRRYNEKARSIRSESNRGKLRSIEQRAFEKLTKKQRRDFRRLHTRPSLTSGETRRYYQLRQALFNAMEIHEWHTWLQHFEPAMKRALKR